MGFRFTPLLLISLTLLVAIGVDWNSDLTWHDQHRIEQIGLLIATALSAVVCCDHVVVDGLVRFKPGVNLSLGLALGLGAVAVVFSAYPRFAALEWSTFLLLLTLALMLAHEAREHADRFDRWMRVLLASIGVIIALKIMTGYVAALVEGVRLDTVLLFEGTFSNRRFFGQVASMIIPLLAFPLLRGDHLRGSRWGWFALLVVWWMLLLVSGTRGSWMALAVAAMVLFLWARRVAWPWLRIQGMGLGLGALLFAVLFLWVPTLLGMEAGIESRLDNLSTLSGREVIWGLAWQQIVQHPWLGIGPMQLASIHNNVGAHPHNSVLQLAAEWGIPAALAWLMAAAIGLIAFLQPLQRVGEDRTLRVCLAAALLAAAAQSMVDGVIVIPYTQLWLVLVVGWALGVHGRKPRVVPTMISATQVWAVRAAALTGGGLLVWGVYPEIFNRAEATAAYLEHHTILLPRYWALGWIT